MQINIKITQHHKSCPWPGWGCEWSSREAFCTGSWLQSVLHPSSHFQALWLWGSCDNFLFCFIPAATLITQIYSTWIRAAVCWTWTTHGTYSEMLKEGDNNRNVFSISGSGSAPWKMPGQYPLCEGEAETVKGLVQSHPASQDSNPGILHYSTLLFVVGL